MSATFRFAEPEELPEVGELAAHSFPGPARTAEWWLDRLRDPVYGGGAGTLWVGEQDGRIAAACQLHPLRQWVGGSALDVMGLGTVAISPTDRRRGLAGRLVASGLRAARERGDQASALYPFRISFYARLGYGLAGEALQYRIPPDCLPDAPERVRVRLADSDAERAEIRAAYAEWARSQTGQLLRPDRVWQQLLAPEGSVLVAYRAGDGRVEGYALAVYRVDLPLQERYLEVEEMVWLTRDARRGLLAWLGSLGDQWRQILLRVLPSHRLGSLIAEPRLPPGSAPGWGLWSASAALLTGPMFRLVDAAAAWRLRGVAPDASLTVGIEVEDPTLPENAGRWRLRLEEGRVEPERGGGPADLSLRLDVGTLSRLFVAALPPSAALDAGLLEADRPQRLPELDRALHLPEPWTFDRF